MARAGLRQATRIEILVLIDNHVDIFLPSTEAVVRAPHYCNGALVPGLLAEHGLSLLVTVGDDTEQHSFLLDTGWSGTGIIYNLSKLHVRVDSIEAVVLSHGHPDHCGGLRDILQFRTFPTPVLIHPEVFTTKRFLKAPTGEIVRFDSLEEEPLHVLGAGLFKHTGPQLFAGDFALATGEIPRKNTFETGLPNAFVDRGGHIEPDMIIDDQGLVLHLRDKGLVVLSGCAHSGVINTIHYAQRLSSESRVHAVIGGFHLCGLNSETRVQKTLEELAALNPEIVCPMHCTGWSPTLEIARRMPRSFAVSSVGARIVLTSVGSA
jgi:7,8-dihydropterin-6-yl-methyl-4-(beta-D-ribofuranosyl)aminobenzene 5'-phosphate synthase